MSSVVTIGNFDGVHLGHQQIIRALIEKAKTIRARSIVYTFKPHPKEILVPGIQLELITSYEERAEILRSLGVDEVVEETFTKTFASLSAENFFNEVLVKRLHTKVIYVGYDFCFGKEKSGNLSTLSDFSQKQGIELQITQPVQVHGEVCSSSRIRRHLKEGSVSSAATLLGREYFCRGQVIKGDGRGRKIGIPTANLSINKNIFLKKGVYATRAIVDGKTYQSVTNVGNRPTFKNNETNITVETHILDFDSDLYGKQIELLFIRIIREEKKFSGVEELVAQIHHDISETRSIFS